MNAIYTSHVNVILHGLFFLDFQNNKLIAKAPEIDMHLYCMASGGAMVNLPPTKPIDIDLSDYLGGLQNGPIDTFPAEIPQFSKSDTGVGEMNGPYHLRLELPLPDLIFPLRCGTLTDFDSIALPGAVQQSIHDACSQGDGSFAILTCVRCIKTSQFPLPDATVCFYAEHEDRPLPADMNKTYTQAGAIFNRAQNFDLRLNEKGPNPTTVDVDRHPPFGMHSFDEYSIPEILQGPSNAAAQRPSTTEKPSSEKLGPVVTVVDVSNCIQFGLKP